MNNKKLSKLLFELSKQSRVTTKELSKLLNISQQTASYMILNLIKKKNILNYQTIIDPAKFGLVNILVFFNYTNFDPVTITKIKRYLQNNPYVTYIEEVSQSADLMIEYCVPNLSLFNKQNRDFLHAFKKEIRINSIYVVIVKRLYNMKYLHKLSPSNEIILSGDRDPIELNKKQKMVLKQLRDNPKETILNIAKEVKLDPKTVINIKKYLERKKIIRKYGVILNHQKLKLNRQHIFIQLDYEDPNETDNFIEFVNKHKNIISVIRIIGDYELLITGEKFELDKPFVDDLRKKFKITDYKIIEGRGILKDNSIPESVFY